MIKFSFWLENYRLKTTDCTWNTFYVHGNHKMNLKIEIGLSSSDVLDVSAISTYENNQNYRVRFSRKVKITERYASTDSWVISYLQYRKQSRRRDKPMI